MPTNIRSNFADFFGTTKLPELEAIILAKQESYGSMIPILFNQEMMSTDIYQTTTVSGLQNPTPKAENVPVTFQTIKSGFRKTYSATTFAAGYRISKESVRDGKFNFIQRATESFAKGFYEVKEFSAAQIFDDAFTVNGYDGVPLCSLLHPLENSGAFGVNRPAVPSALSVTSFRELRNIMQDTLNENGQLVKYAPQYLVTPQLLQDVAKEIVASEFDPRNANNAINTVYNYTQLLPGGMWQYLASDTAFFMVSPKNDHHLMFMLRQGMETDSDYDKQAFAHELIANERWDFGYSSWRGVAGNPGA